MKLYGSGGKSSKAILEPYQTAVEKLAIKIREMIITLPDPTEWQTLEKDEEKKEAFLLAFKEAAEQHNLVEQYYQYKWDDDSFGLSYRKWLHYLGAYKNLTWEPDSSSPDIPINTLVGKTKLAGTQVIDASHILNLIGSKTTISDGKQTVDTETIRIIYQQIEELSNMGEHEEAELLKEFVIEELEPGNVSSDISFDDAFELWKKEKRRKVVYEISQEWGLNTALLERAIDTYSVANPNDIPFIEDLMSNVDFASATNKKTNNLLEHNILLNEYLHEVIPKLKIRYK